MILFCTTKHLSKLFKIHNLTKRNFFAMSQEWQMKQTQSHLDATQCKHNAIQVSWSNGSIEKAGIKVLSSQNIGFLRLLNNELTYELKGLVNRCLFFLNVNF